MVSTLYIEVCENTQKKGQRWPPSWKQLQWKDSIWCVTVALDILQSPLVVQLCKEGSSKLLINHSFISHRKSCVLRSQGSFSPLKQDCVNWNEILNCSLELSIPSHEGDLLKGNERKKQHC